MEDLVQWLAAQLDTDTARARAACHGEEGRWRHGDDMGISPARVVDEGGETVVYDEGAPSVEQAEHIAEWDPARVLREIDAKRGVVARYEFACKGAASLGISEEERETRVRVAAAFESSVLCLAGVYSDRPGYAEALASLE